MPQREFEQKQPDVSAPPAWEQLPWQPEDRVAAEPEKREEMQVVLADQNEHVVEVPLS